MATLVDSNILVSFLIESEKTDEAEKILEVIDEPATTQNVLRGYLCWIFTDVWL